MGIKTGLLFAGLCAVFLSESFAAEAFTLRDGDFSRGSGAVDEAAGGSEILAAASSGEGAGLSPGGLPGYPAPEGEFNLRRLLDGEAPPASENGSGFTISGSVSYGLDATFWWLDDSFSANLIEMETNRDTPLFHEIKLQLNNVFGTTINLNFFLDKFLQPAGLFNFSFEEGLTTASGGFQGEIVFPLGGLAQTLFHELDWDVDEFFTEHLEFGISYRYRIFRWDNKIVSKWLDSTVDYYDEKGNYHPYGIGASFSAGSRMNDLIFGFRFYGGEDFPLGIFLGIQYFNLEAPTLLGLEGTGDSLYSPVADVLMFTSNNFWGLKFSMFSGPDRQDLSTLTEDINLGFDFGMSIGGFSGENQYFKGPSSLGFNLNLSGLGGFKFPLWEGAEAKLLFGADWTFSLLSNFGSADAPGKITKNLAYHYIGSAGNIPAGTEVYVSLSRWETYVAPFVKLAISF